MAAPIAVAVHAAAPPPAVVVLPVVVVVWVDDAYGVIGWKQDRRFGRTHAIAFDNPDWARLAAAFGWAHAHAGSAQELGAALAAHLPGERPALVTVPIDYTQNRWLAAFGEPALGA